MQKLNVLYQSNDTFAPYLGTSLQSLLANNAALEELNVYLVNIDISQENIEKLKKQCESFNRKLILIDAAKIRRKIKESGMPEYQGFRKNNMSLMKIFAIDDIPEETVLYIDCDTIIAGSLAGLCAVNMQGRPIGMVADSIISNEYKLDIGMKESAYYYNSGIILFDAEQWKAQHCIEKIVAFAQQGRVFGTVDQDYLNVVLEDNVYTLPLQYNVQCIHFLCSAKGYANCFKNVAPYYGFDEIQEACKHPTIAHYEKFASMSPWHKNSVNPCTKMFDSYLKQSPWSNYEKQECKANAFQFQVEKILYRCLPHDVFVHVFKIASDRMLLNSSRQAAKLGKA